MNKLVLKGGVGSKKIGEFFRLILLEISFKQIPAPITPPTTNNSLLRVREMIFSCCVVIIRCLCITFEREIK